MLHFSNLVQEFEEWMVSLEQNKKKKNYTWST